jgi:hypothetical protein
MHFSGNVIDRLNTTPRVVAYYFFDSRWKESLSIITFLRSILHQVLPIDTVSPAILPRLREIFDSSIESREPDFSELQQLITDICETQTQTQVFVIDGLDELDKDARKSVLLFLRTMQARVKIFAASQPEVNLTAFSVSCKTINITVRDSENDIRNFIQVRLEEVMKCNKVLSAQSPHGIEVIKEALALGAQGMYVLKSFTVPSANVPRRSITEVQQRGAPYWSAGAPPPVLLMSNLN